MTSFHNPDGTLNEAAIRAEFPILSRTVRKNKGAYCQALRRTKIANYDIADAKVLADFGILS